MNFLSPAFLLGLPLVAAPVVIHLLSRRQQRKISWGAMRFLVEAATRRRRLWKLTDMLLLALRAAAFLLFILALARPQLASDWLGGGAPREVILVLDTSLSTSRRVDGAPILQKQVERANALLDELTRADSFRILLAGETPEWLIADPVPAGGAGTREARRQLSELRPAEGAGDLIACVREAVDLEPQKDKAARLIVVVTDGQRAGWRRGEQTLWEAVQTRIDNASIPTALRVERVGADAPTDNVAVERIETERAFGAVGQSLAFTATLANHGKAPSAATLLEWEVDGMPAGVATAPALGAGETTTLRLSHAFSDAGSHEVVCRLQAADAMSGDDTARMIVDIHDRLPVLFVEPAGEGDPLEQDAPFALAALGYRDPTIASDGSTGTSAWRSVFEPAVVEPAALETLGLGAFRAIVLADVGRVSDAARAKLEAYARNGGGVWLALGSRTSPEDFNEQWFRSGLGLSPMRLGAPEGDANDRETYFTVRAASETHPATALLADFQRLDLDRARVYRRHQFLGAGGGAVAALLQAQQGQVVAFERRMGQGRIIAQAMPLGTRWSNLPLCQAYVALLHEWLWRLCEPGLPRRNLTPGEALVEVAPEEGAIAVLRRPDGVERELRAESGEGRGARFRTQATRLPGLYALRVKGGVAPSARFHVRRDPRESDLSPLTDEDRKAMEGLGVGFERGLELSREAEHQPAPRRPLENGLLGALAAAFVAELGVAAWTTHRRRARLPALSMTA